MSPSRSKRRVSLPEQLLLGDWGGESNSTVDSINLQSPAPPPSPADGRSTAVWRQWLSSMASDAEAALAAAIAYREMDAEGREKWLASLKFDAPNVDVPRIALYAPLLAVEQDPERRDRLMVDLEEAQEGGDQSLDDWGQPISEEKRSFVGRGARGEKVFVLSSPLYLEFVQVLACGVAEGKFLWVRHEPIMNASAAPGPGDELEGASLESAPVKSVLDDLALAVLSHQRSGEPLPEALEVLGDLLGALGP